MPFPFILGAIGAAVAGAGAAAGSAAAAAATAAATTAATAAAAGSAAAGLAGTAAAGLTGAAGSAVAGLTGAAGTVAAGLTGASGAAGLAAKGLSGITSKIVLSNAARAALTTGAKAAFKIPWTEINKGITTVLLIEQARHLHADNKLEEELKRIRAQQAENNVSQPNLDPAEKARLENIFKELFKTEMTEYDIMQAFNEVRRKPLDVNSKVDWIEFEEFKKMVYNIVAQINNSVADV